MVSLSQNLSASEQEEWIEIGGGFGKDDLWLLSTVRSVCIDTVQLWNLLKMIEWHVRNM